jgi:glycosyltransferase involved in cell wall biosynthesis
MVLSPDVLQTFEKRVRNSLRVAMVVRNFSAAGGLELYAHKLIEGLLERGNEVTVFCQTVDTSLNHRNLKVKFIQLRRAGLSKSDRFEHDHIAGNRALQNEQDFDIIHSQHYPVSRANVVTFHNHAVRRWSVVGLGWEKLINEAKYRLVRAYKLRDFQDRMLCAGAECLVFPSQIMQRDYYESYPFLTASKKPYVVAYPGSTLLGDSSIDGEDELSEPPRQTKSVAVNSSATSDVFSFLFVGRGFRRKGLDILLAACSKLARERNDFRLLIAGLEGKPLDEARLILMGLEGKVEYLGFQKDMEQVYGRAQAAVLPSRVEPFGMAPLQAMECGLVPIVSRVSGASEVLSDGEDSLILENHLDAGELARLMSKLMNDPALVRRLAQGARATARRVNWNQTVENTLRAYEMVLRGSNADFQAAVK